MTLSREPRPTLAAALCPGGSEGAGRQSSRQSLRGVADIRRLWKVGALAPRRARAAGDGASLPSTRPRKEAVTGVRLSHLVVSPSR